MTNELTTKTAQRLKHINTMIFTTNVNYQKLMLKQGKEEIINFKNELKEIWFSCNEIITEGKYKGQSSFDLAKLQIRIDKLIQEIESVEKE